MRLCFCCYLEFLFLPRFDRPSDFYQVELLPLLPQYVFQALLNPELPVPKDDPVGLEDVELPQDLVLLLLSLPELPVPKVHPPGLLPEEPELPQEDLVLVLSSLLPKAFMMLLLLSQDMMTAIRYFVCVNMGVDETCVL